MMFRRAFKRLWCVELHHAVTGGAIAKWVPRWYAGQWQHNGWTRTAPPFDQTITFR